MGYTVPTTEPQTLRAGDTWSWRREDLADYPASTWTLVYHLRNSTHFIDITAIAAGEAHAVSVPAATTVGYSAGAYDWYAFVSDGTDRHQVGTGRIEVLPDVSAASAYDGRVWARKMLDAVEAALLGRATTDQLDVVQTAIGDRSLSRDRAGLITLRSQLLSEAAREEAAGAGRVGQQRIVVRF